MITKKTRLQGNIHCKHFRNVLLRILFVVLLYRRSVEFHCVLMQMEAMRGEEMEEMWREVKKMRIICKKLKVVIICKRLLLLMNCLQWIETFVRFPKQIQIAWEKSIMGWRRICYVSIRRILQLRLFWLFFSSSLHIKEEKVNSNIL